MRVNRVVEISTLKNKNHYYLYNQVFSIAKENKVYGEFGNDFIDLYNVPKKVTNLLDKAQIIWRRLKV